jgi:alpha-L-rhamnosidase
MMAQEHESLLCPPIELGYPFKGKSTSPHVALGLPEPSLLDWTDLEPPLATPQPEVGRDFYLTYDLGRQTNGCLLFTIETETECVVDIGYADHLRQRRVDPTVQFNLSDRVVVASGRSQVRLPHDRGCRYLQLSLSQAATLHEIAWEEHVFAHDRARRFHSSDFGLNAIWEAAENTIRQVSLSFYADNARRERQGWIGTELIHTARGSFAVFGDVALARKHIIDGLECADYQDGLVPCNALGNTPKEWLRALDAHDLCVPQTFRDYIQRSDDRELAPRLLEASVRMIEHHSNIGSKGLKERIGVWCWTGWTFNASTSVVTGHNLLLIEALRATADLYRYLGQDEQAEELAAREAPLIEAIFRELLDPERGVLCQGLDPRGKRVPFCSQADNARALLLGIVPQDMVEHFHRFAAGPSGSWPTNRSSWQGLTTRGDRIRYHPQQTVAAGSPFDSLIAVDTIAALESPQDALNYIRYNFGAMVDEGEGTLWECWNQHGITEGTSCYSQGWGTAVAFQILQHILGARFAEPGGTLIEWRPRRVSVRELSARIRTTHGDVTLGWAGENLQWEIPEGVTVRIVRDSRRESRDITGPSNKQG